MGADALYYIMDYSGNYYRTNQADQLVSVVSQQDAMVFTFAQANSRICVGKKAAFYCMIPIEDSEDETDAAECEEVSPAEEMGVNDMEKQENTGVEEYFSPIKELTYDELTEQVEKDVSSYDLSEIDYDLMDSNEGFLIDEYASILMNLADVKSRLDYLNRRVLFTDQLVLNESDRYETSNGRMCYTSGSPIEFQYIDEAMNEEGEFIDIPTWRTSTVEHNGTDYYIVGYPEIDLDGLKVRVRE